MDKEISDIVAALTENNWTELENIYTEIKNHTGSFIENSDEGPEPDGTIVLGGTVSSPIVHRTMQFFYDKKLIVGFDWPNWDEGRNILRREGDDRFADLSLEDVLKLFTAVMRNDRFNDGAFARLFEEGDAQRLLARLLDFKPKAS